MRPDYKTAHIMMLVAITASTFKMLELYVLYNDAIGLYPIRPVGGDYETEGCVEIFYDGEWGTVCDDIWELQDVHIVCREIGTPTSTICNWLDSVQCTGTELYLSECPHSSWNSQNCVHSEDAGICCNMTGCDLGGRNNSDIRLTGSTNQGSGHVEIHVGNQWGIGVPSVMCSGGLRMLKLLVGIWVTVEPCRLLVEDSLDKELVPSIVPKCFAKDLNPICWCAHHNLTQASVIILWMLVSSAL
ncbi:neurotrypsin-like isoform X3 [Dysidea avara]